MRVCCRFLRYLQMMGPDFPAVLETDEEDMGSWSAVDDPEEGEEAAGDGDGGLKFAELVWLMRLTVEELLYEITETVRTV
jgi:hypothetical protein